MKEKEEWRLEKETAAWKILNGWLSASFKDWLSKTAAKRETNLDGLLLGVAETIRKISTETLAILNQENNQNINIPIFIIAGTIKSDFTAANIALKISGGDTAILKNREKSFNTLHPFSRLSLYFSAILEATAWLSGGLVVLGVANGVMTGYSDGLIREMIEQYYSKTPENETIDKFIRAAVEETMHYFDHITNPELMKKWEEEYKERAVAGLTFQEEMRLGEELEEKYGFKKKVAELLVEVLKNKNSLFSPLEEKIPKTP